ncbi:MAG: 6-pyruvoyl-tetrahydropterin synthase-related protein [Actinomycetota bacterium]
MIGGDYGGHTFMVSYLREQLLPQMRLSGWTNHWFLGFPIYHFYFPLPGLLQSALASVISAPVAFKVGAMIGTFSLPWAAYLFGRSLGLPFPTPGFMSLSTIPFLAMTSFDHFGGNILSTFRGEYAYSLGFSLSLIILGLWCRSLAGGRPTTVLLGVLIGLATVTHLIPVVFCLVFMGIVALAFSIAGPERVWEITRGLLLPIVLGAALSAIYWLPTSLDRDFTSNAELAEPHSLHLVLPDSLGPLPASVPILLLVAIKQRRVSAVVVGGVAIAGLVGYLIVPPGQLNGARFLPYWYLGIMLSSATAVALMMTSAGADARGRISLVAMTAAVAVSGQVFLATKTPLIRHRAEVTLGGFERAPAGDAFTDLAVAMDELPSGRILYEKNPNWIHLMGTDLPFASVPSQTRHQAVYGVNRQASASTPFIDHVQRELSPDYYSPKGAIRSLNDTQGGISHARHLGIDYFVTVSDEAASRLEDEGVPKLLHVDPFSVFDLQAPPEVTIPRFEPVVLDDVDWETRVWSWWLGPDRDVPLVASGPKAWARTSSDGDLPREPLATPHVIDSEINDGHITFTTNRIGEPHLIRVSFFPKWTASGALGPFRASPNFMVVVPTQERVTLTYRDRTADQIARLLTVISLIAVLLYLGVRALVAVRSRFV